MSKMTFNPNCDRCTLCEGATSICMEPVKGDSPKLMVVLNYPSVEEDQTGNPFSDQPILQKLLFDVLSIPTDSVYLTYLAKCRPLGGNTEPSELKTCLHEYLDREIEELNPFCILLMGGDVCDAVMGKSIKSLRGDVHSYLGYSVIGTYSPSMGRKDPDILQSIAEDMYRAYSITAGVEVVETDTECVEVNDDVTLLNLIEYIKRVGTFSFDFETTGLDIFTPDFRPTCLSISFQSGCSYVIPLYHLEKTELNTPIGGELIPVSVPILHSVWIDENGGIDKLLIDSLWEVFEDFSIDKVAHNAKFDGCILKKFFGFYPEGCLYDTMTMYHVLYNNEKCGLKRIVEVYFPYLKGYEDETKRHKWSEVPWSTLKQYGGTDADVTLRLKWILEAELLEDLPSYLVYRNLMSASIRPLMQAEYEGSLIDINRLNEGISLAERRLVELDGRLREFPEVIQYNERERRAQIGKKVKELEEKERGTDKEHLKKGYQEKILKLKSGEVEVFNGINFNSPIQLKALLFGANGFRFKIPLDQYGRKLEDTNKDTLTLIEDSTGFINAILNYRGVQKVLSTYLNGIKERLDSNSRVHGTFLQHGTATFRMSSANPNMQNMITRSDFTDVLELISYVKGSFVPPEGQLIIQGDFSQLELRIMAYLANEETMIAAYQNDQDLHEITAANDRGINLDDFKRLDKDTYKKYRFEAKASNFGLIYGQSAKGFMEYSRAQYGITLTEQQSVKRRAKFFAKYPKLLQYHEIIKRQALKNGYVKTLFGARVNLPDIYSPQQGVKSHAERNAINSPTQGTGGQIGQFGIALLYRRLPKDVKLFNTVHDSIANYSPPKLFNLTRDTMKETLENLPLEQYFGVRFDRVPLKVDLEASTKSWKDMEPIDSFDY